MVPCFDRCELLAVGNVALSQTWRCNEAICLRRKPSAPYANPSFIFTTGISLFFFLPPLQCFWPTSLVLLYHSYFIPLLMTWFVYKSNCVILFGVSTMEFYYFLLLFTDKGFTYCRWTHSIFTVCEHFVPDWPPGRCQIQLQSIEVETFWKKTDLISFGSHLLIVVIVDFCLRIHSLCTMRSNARAVSTQLPLER